MTGKVLPFDASAHLSVDALLPFFVNATLNREERAFVQDHLDSCAQCQHEVEWLRRIFAELALRAPLPEMPLASSFGSGADADIAEPVAPRASIAKRWGGTPPWTRWLLAAQLAAIFVLGGALLTAPREGASYRTLAAPTVAPTMQKPIAVMFDPTTSESELEQIVLRVGGRITDGPTSTGVFVLEITTANIDGALQTLRSERAVRLAEPLGATARQ
jgi:hypothetical protein